MNNFSKFLMLDKIKQFNVKKLIRQSKTILLCSKQLIFDLKDRLLWNNKLLLDKFEEKTSIPPIVVFLISGLVMVLLSPILAHINHDINSIDQYLSYIILQMILLGFFTLIYYLIRYFQSQYENLLLEYKNRKLLTQTDYNELLHKMGVNIVRIGLVFFYVWYLWLRGIDIDYSAYLELRSLGISNYPLLDNEILVFITIVIGRIFGSIIYIAVIPDIVSALVGVLFWNVKLLVDKIDLTDLHSDNIWGLNEIGNFLFKLFKYCSIILLLSNVLLVIVYIFVIDVIREFTQSNEFLTLFWFLFPLLLITLIYIIPHYSAKHILSKRKKLRLREYYSVLNTLNNKLNSSNQFNTEIHTQIQTQIQLINLIKNNKTTIYEVKTLWNIFQLTVITIISNIIISSLPNIISILNG